MQLCMEELAGRGKELCSTQQTQAKLHETWGWSQVSQNVRQEAGGWTICGQLRLLPPLSQGKQGGMIL